MSLTHQKIHETISVNPIWKRKIGIIQINLWLASEHKDWLADHVIVFSLTIWLVRWLYADWPSDWLCNTMLSDHCDEINAKYLD